MLLVLLSTNEGGSAISARRRGWVRSERPATRATGRRNLHPHQAITGHNPRYPSRMSKIVIVAAKRTAFGTMQGALKNVSATDLAVVASKAAIHQSGIGADRFDHVVIGNVMQTSPDAIY